LNFTEQEIQAQKGDGHITEETIPMKQTWHGHSAFRIEASEAKILIDPFLSDNPSWGKGWSGDLAGKNSTQGGDR
jgi:Beta-lactamase superfamily domain